MLAKLIVSTSYLPNLSAGKPGHRSAGSRRDEIEILDVVLQLHNRRRRLNGCWPRSWPELPRGPGRLVGIEIAATNYANTPTLASQIPGASVLQS